MVRESAEGCYIGTVMASAYKRPISNIKTISVITKMMRKFSHQQFAKIPKDAHRLKKSVKHKFQISTIFHHCIQKIAYLITKETYLATEELHDSEVLPALNSNSLWDFNERRKALP